jgi:hypothetical protein
MFARVWFLNWREKYQEEMGNIDSLGFNTLKIEEAKTPNDKNL